MTNEKLMHLFREGRVTEKMLKQHIATLEARAQKLREQRDSANALIAILLDEGDDSVPKN